MAFMSSQQVTMLWTLLISWTFTCVLCHPQCLDYRAPFKPQTPLTFCSQYSDLGCCGQLNDRALQGEYNYLQTKVSPDDWDRCRGFVKQILCQKCSPYAAHIYDAERTAKPRQFPGLCQNYCGSFYDKCSSLMWLLDSGTALRHVLSNKEEFCSTVALKDVDYCYPELLGNPMLNRNLTERPTSMLAATEGCLCLEKVKGDLANPLWARHAGDGSGRLFVAMQKGQVNIYNTNTKQWYRQPFLDLSRALSLSSFAGDERGFLGMAFHPDYPNNGRFFLYYSTKRTASDEIPPELQNKRGSYSFKIRISEMTVMANNPNIADTSSEKVVLEVLQPYANHNGGELFFGQDGYLYAFVGDGGAAGDPLDAGQDKGLLLGKVLRLDVDSDPSQPYTIPPDNPFVNEPGTKPEIYAYGIRNIWRCGMDRGDRATGANRGRVLCGDVGQNAFEEIDLLQKGANYGWNAKEGFECYDEDLCDTIVNDTPPVWAYNHQVGKSVTGGVFYRGCENPALNGQYIFGDYVTSRLFSLSESGGQWTHADVSLCGGGCQGDLVGYMSHYILSFGEDEEGEIYVLTSKSSGSKACDGTIYKIVDPSTRNDPSACGVDLTEGKRIRVPKRKSSGAIVATDSEDLDAANTRRRRQRRNKSKDKKSRRQRRKSLRRRRKPRKPRRNRKNKATKGSKRKQRRNRRKYRRRRRQKKKSKC